jgi:serine/threonine-protein kinase
MVLGQRTGIGCSAVVLLALVGTLGVTTRADAAPTPSEVAIAQGLYDAAKKLMGEGRFLEASAKLEESMRLDPGLGTQYQLADCYEHVGKTASAWAAYLQIAATAHGSGQAEREKVARARVKALEAKVPHLVIVVPLDSRASDLEVKRDGTVVGPAQYDTLIPLDPGPHTISATARGKSWEQQTTLLIDGATTKVTIPVLGEDAPPPPIAAAAEPVHAAPVQPEPAPEQPSTGGTQRTLGVLTAGVGLVGIGLGTFFGVQSMGKNSDAKQECDATGCSPAGVTLRNDAISAGNLSTISFIAGGVLFAGGVTLYLTAPRRPDATGVARALRGSPSNVRVGIAPQGVFATGSF